jgi:hypothetical protein
VTANLGPGDDTLNLATGALVRFAGPAVFNGQGGANTAYVDFANIRPTVTLKNFQVNPL